MGLCHPNPSFVCATGYTEYRKTRGTRYKKKTKNTNENNTNELMTNELFTYPRPAKSAKYVLN